MVKISKGKMLLLIFIIVSAALSLLHVAGAFSVQSLRASDALYAPAEPLEEIVILKIDDQSIQKIGRWPWDRSAYAEVLERVQNAKVVGIDISFFEPSAHDAELEDAINRYSNVVLVAEEVPADEGTNVLRPIVESPYVGHANVFVDEDGVTREIPTKIGDEDETIKAFSVKIAEVYLGEDYFYQLNKIIAGSQMPIGPAESYFGEGSSFDSFSSLLVNFAEPFESHSFYEVLEDSELAKSLAGKIVLIGATAPDLHDFRITPVAESMPGVELHANAVQTILTGAFLERQSAESVALAIFMLSLIVALSLYFSRAVIATVITAVAGAGYLFFSFNLFFAGTVMNIFYPLLSLVLTYVFGMVSLYVFESRQRRLVTGIFGKYVSKGVAEHILKSGDVSLKGEKRDISILFADIRGFTSLSEKLQPEEVVAMLNYYFDAMTKIVFKHGGTLDKFIGDCIMAEWNVPLTQEEHALLAVHAAVEMQAEVKKLAKEGKYPAVKYGIGINTGPAIVGNMGSVERVDYTAIGDSVNLASRLCGVAEGGKIIISEATYELVKEKVKARRLKPVKVKGKEKPIVVYEVVGMRS